MNWSSLWEKVQAHAVTLVFAALSAVIPGVVLLAQKQLAAYAEEHPVATVRIVAGLAFVALWSAGMFFYYRPRLRFDKRLGIYRDRKTGLYYCTSCLIANQLKVPLTEMAHGWACGVKSCGKFYPNPDYKKPPRAARLESN